MATGSRARSSPSRAPEPKASEAGEPQAPDEATDAPPEELDMAVVDAAIAALGGAERAIGVVFSRARELAGPADEAALCEELRYKGTLPKGVTQDANGNFRLADGTRATHPDHGPMALIPRREDGTISRYYYCSQEQLDGFDLTAPPLRERADGWTPDVQAEFVRHLADSGSVTRACQAVGRSRTSAYTLRRDPSARAFARAWDEALASTATLLAETALDRAVNGTEEAVFYKGRRIGHRMRHDNRLLLALLRARDPLNYAPLDELERWDKRRPGPQASISEVAERLRLSEKAWGEASQERLAAPEDVLTADPAKEPAVKIAAEL